MTAVVEVSLREWAAELEAAATIARKIAETDFLPISLKRYFKDDRGRPLDGKDGRPERLDVDSTTATAAAAIMTGAELGLKPGAAMRSISVINNTPTLNAITLRAILQHAGHDIWVVPESNSTKAIVRARRADSTEVQESTWTIDRARTAGLYPGSERGQWRKNPGAMLIARATAEAARWIASDAILGIPYIAEELIDQIEGGAEPPLAVDGDRSAAAVAAPGLSAPAAIEAAAASTPAAPARRRRKTATPAPSLPTGPPAPAPISTATAAAEPEVVEPVEAEIVDEAASNEVAKQEPPEVAAANATPVPHEPDPAPAPIAKAQLDRLHPGLREIGATERDEALGLISAWVGRDVGSTKDLTTGEASIVLDRLDKLRALGAGLAEVGIVDEAEALGLVSAWAGRRVRLRTDLSADELTAVLERLDALRSVGAVKVDEGGEHDS